MKKSVGKLAGKIYKLYRANIKDINLASHDKRSKEKTQHQLFRILIQLFRKSTVIETLKHTWNKNYKNQYCKSDKVNCLAHGVHVLVH